MLEQLHTAYPWIIPIFVLLIGACWGSFLNVVVYRMPLGKSVVYPGSCCTRCGKPIRFYDNLPVLSWFILRGRSRCCHTPFSIRYPLVEAVTALLFLASWHAYGPAQPLVVLAGWALITLLVSGALIDYDTQMLPDLFTVWGMVIGVVISMLIPALHGIGEQTTSFHSVYGVMVETSTQEPAIVLALRGGFQAALGAVVGAGTLLWIAIMAETVLRKEAMGFGDVLLMGCIGAFCGWQGSLFAIFGGALIGCVGILLLTVLNKVFGLKLSPGKTSANGPVAMQNGQPAQSEQAEPSESPKQSKQPDLSTATEDNTPPKLGLGVAIPFGPWLAAGALVYFLFLRGQTADYLANLAELLLPR